MSSKLAELYKQADLMVQDDYARDPEDHWKLKAIDEHRRGVQNHDSVMTQFVVDVEKAIEELSKPQPIPVSVAPAVAPKAALVTEAPKGKQYPKTPDNPEGADLEWN